MQRIFRSVTACILLASFFPQARAALVINEVMWMGSDLSVADEWVELACVGEPTDLHGYSLRIVEGSEEEGETEKEVWRFDGQKTLEPETFLLIARRPAHESRLAIDPDFLTPSLSLPNTKLRLRLYDGEGNMVDEADDGIGVPFAGANPSGGGAKASMERIVPLEPGTIKENWRTATTFIGFDDGAKLFGTPGFANGSGATEDVMPPSDATHLSAVRLDEDSVRLTWTPSTSLDLAEQIVMLEIGDAMVELITLPASANTLVLPLERGVSRLLLLSVDDSGNRSLGAVVDIVDDIVPVAPAMVLLTEVLANPIGNDDEEWIEIGNLGDERTDIAGWILSNGTANGAYVIPSRSASGYLVEPGEHVMFPKSVTGLALANKGGTITLRTASGDTADAWGYPETAEEVSYGRHPQNPDQFIALCIPTPGAPNAILPPEPVIHIQSGQTYGQGKVSLNLQTLVERGSVASLSCAWEYGNGYENKSCNPPSHTFSNPGSYLIKLYATDYCGNTIIRSLPVHVSATPTQQNTTLQSSEQAGTQACTIEATEGVRISEFLPDPGEKGAEEWIEIENVSGRELSLCGWSIDDEEGESKAFAFGDIRLRAGEYRSFPASATRIALNNGADSVRLFAPASLVGGERLVEEVRYEKSVKGESYARRGDNIFLWTPFLTPGAPNRFRTADSTRALEVIVSAALPNPVGKDQGAEWIELENRGSETAVLDGWMLDNKEGGSKPYVLKGVRLKSGETRRFSDRETGIVLTNTSDMARLLDPDGTTVSFLTWKNAPDGRIYRVQAYEGERVSGTVSRVIDGDTFDVDLAEPSSVFGSRPSVRVRLMGIDAPESVHPTLPVSPYGMQSEHFLRALIEGKKIELHFDTETWDAYGRALAYAYVSNNKFVQEDLLRAGMASVYLRFPFAKREEFLVYEAEAKKARAGIWADEAFAESILLAQHAQEEDFVLEEKGMKITARPASGFVEPGTIVRYTASVPSDFYLLQETGPVSFSGSITILDDARVHVLALARSPSCREKIDAESVDFLGSLFSGDITHDDAVSCIATYSGSYLLKKASYRAEVIISEVYPKPFTQEEQSDEAGPLYDEWIELHNPLSHPVDLSGWQLDDSADGGSKPYTIPFGTTMAPGEYRVFFRKATKLVLNDDTDMVRLLSPNGDVTDEMRYEKFKNRGWSVARTEAGWCVTGVPTPGAVNVCATVPVAAMAKKSSSAALKTVTIAASVLKPKYRNIARHIGDLHAASSPVLSHLRAKSVAGITPAVIRQGSDALPLETPLIGITAFGTGWFLSLGKSKGWLKIDKKSKNCSIREDQ